MWEVIVNLIKSCKSTAALEKVQTFIVKAYHGESTELGYISNRRYSEIMDLLKARMKELDEGSTIIEAIKDFLL